MKHNKSNKNTFTKSEAKKVREKLRHYGRHYGSFETAAKNILHTRSKKAVEFCKEIGRRLSYSDWLQLSEHERTNFKFLAKVKLNMKDFAASLPSSGYSMGETKVVSAKGLPHGKYDNRRQYARSFGYRARHGEIYAEIPVEYAAKGQSLGGLITIIGQKVRGNIYHCKWLEINQIKKYRPETEVHEENGYGFYYTNEYGTKFYHAATYTDAVKAQKKFIAQYNLYCLHRRISERVQKIKMAVEKMDYKLLCAAVGKKSLERLYCFDDSRAAGNCEAGTLNFFRLCGYNREERATGADIIRRAFTYAPNTLSYMVKIFYK